MLINFYYEILLVSENDKILIFSGLTGMLVTRIQVNDSKRSVPVTIQEVVDDRRSNSAFFVISEDGQVFSLDFCKIEGLNLSIDKRISISSKNPKATLKAYCTQDTTFEEGLKDIVEIGVNEKYLEIYKNSLKIKKQEFDDFTSIASFPLYYTRIATNLVKELLDSEGNVKSISSKNLEIIERSEKEDLGTVRVNLIPKLLYLTTIKNTIACHMTEFFFEKDGELNFFTTPSSQYFDNSIYQRKLVLNNAFRQ